MSDEHVSDEKDENPRFEHGNSAHGDAADQVTLEQGGEELTEAEAAIEVERAPGGGQAVPSFRDVDAEERAKYRSE
jgi:hypothetical protein